MTASRTSGERFDQRKGRASGRPQDAPSCGARSTRHGQAIHQAPIGPDAAVPSSATHALQVTDQQVREDAKDDQGILPAWIHGRSVRDSAAAVTATRRHARWTAGSLGWSARTPASTSSWRACGAPARWWGRRGRPARPRRRPGEGQPPRAARTQKARPGIGAPFGVAEAVIEDAPAVAPSGRRPHPAHARQALPGGSTVGARHAAPTGPCPPAWWVGRSLATRPRAVTARDPPDDTPARGDQHPARLGVRQGPQVQLLAEARRRWSVHPADLRLALPGVPHPRAAVLQPRRP
jgi:hypothetical protein